MKINGLDLRENLRAFIFSICLIVGFEVMLTILKSEDTRDYYQLGILILFLTIVASLVTFKRQAGYYRKILPYLIHPVFLFIGLTLFLVFNQNPVLRQITILLTGGGYFVLFSEHYSDLTHHAHDGVKFLSFFLLYNSILEGVQYLGAPLYLSPILISLFTLLFVFHMFWRLKVKGALFPLLGLFSSVGLGVGTWILLDVYLFSSYLILSLILLAAYYIVWGVLHHLIDKNLTATIFFEYLFIGLIIISMFLGLTTGW